MPFQLSPSISRACHLKCPMLDSLDHEICEMQVTPSVPRLLPLTALSGSGTSLLSSPLHSSLFWGAFSLRLSLGICPRGNATEKIGLGLAAPTFPAHFKFVTPP